MCVLVIWDKYKPLCVCQSNRLTFLSIKTLVFQYQGSCFDVSAVTAVADTSGNSLGIGMMSQKTQLGEIVDFKEDSVLMGEYERGLCVQNAQ